MSRVPSRFVRGSSAAVASPAVAGFRLTGAALAIAAAFSLQPLVTRAQPAGAQVIHGAASLARNGNNLVVTTQNGAGTSHSAINWQSFSVPGGSTTRFNQPSAASTSVNRVLGPDPSAIFGTLSSNGKLVLVNPAGITVGKGAVVDTAGFAASTLSMNEADAIAGRLLFGGAGGPLQVDGRIVARGGDVVLIAPQVSTGADAVVTSSQGATVLAAGQKVEITGRGLEGIRLEVQAPWDSAVNLGRLDGDAVGMFAGTLRHSGLVSARAVTVDGGKVVLRASGDNRVSGTVTAAGPGGIGGSIDVFGNTVGLLAGASLQASGRAGGGQVRVGGDYQGANAAVPNAQSTYVDPQAQIAANATDSGDGGRVIVWADGRTEMHGRIAARGGRNGGDGGFAEVSGKKTLAYTGSTDLRAPRGATGTLLLDPEVIRIVADIPAIQDPATFYVEDGALSTQLTTANVELQAFAGSSAGPASGMVFLEAGANVAWTPAATPAPSAPPVSSPKTTLSLVADNGIVMDGTVNSPGGGLELRTTSGNIAQGSGGVVTIDTLYVSTGSGNVTMNGPNHVGTLAGDVNGTGTVFQVTNDQSLLVGSFTRINGATAAGINTSFGGNGAVTLATRAGNLAVEQNIYGQAITLDAKADVLVGTAGSVYIQGNDGVTINAGGNADFGASTTVRSYQAPLSVTAAGSILGQGNFYTSGGGLNGAITLTANGGSLSFNYASSGSYSSTPSGDITLKAKGDVNGNYLLAATGYDFSSTVGAAGGGTVSVTSDTGNIRLGSIRAQGASAGSGSGGMAGRVFLTSTLGNVELLDGIYLFAGGGPTGGHGGVVDIQAAGTVTFPRIQAQGGYGTSVGGIGASVTVNAAGGILMTPPDGSPAIDAGGGWVDMGGQGGQGGSITLTSTGGSIRAIPVPTSPPAFAGATPSGGIDLVTTAGGSVDAYRYYYYGSEGGIGGTGGQGGNVTIRAGGDVEIPSIGVYGGTGGVFAGVVAPGVHGGPGGNANVAFGGTLAMNAIYALGGQGTDYTNGGNGGHGGHIVVERSSGNLVANDSLSLEAGGGFGGNAASEGGGLGGVGGNGGSITLRSGLAGTGAITLDAPRLFTDGGLGGFHADSLARAPSGALGSLVTEGSTVAVNGAWDLVANWTTDAATTVNVGDTAFVGGIGQVFNHGTINIGGSAALVPGFGVLNKASGVVNALSGDSSVTLAGNLGQVNVATGAILSAPFFFFNEGGVNVNGVLDIGNCRACGAVSAAIGSGPTFANMGTLSGAGLVIVGDGLGTVDNSGTIAPGASSGSVGTLSLAANLLLRSIGTIAVDVQSTGSHDVLSVAGTTRTEGGTLATNWSGGTFNIGDAFNVIQSSSLDAPTLPTATGPFNVVRDGESVRMVATAQNPPPTAAPTPAPTSPPPTSAPPPAPTSAPPPPAQAPSPTPPPEIVTFAHLFVEMAEAQREEAKKNEIGKDDIVVTDTACTP